MTTKICSKCGLEKDLDEFGNLKSSKDGKLSRCKECTKEYMKEYQRKNAEHISEQNARKDVESACSIYKF